MKLIAEGYYHKVYASGDGRVLKKLQPHWYSLMQVYRVVRKREGDSVARALKKAYKYVSDEVGKLREMRVRIVRMDSWIFANPEFIKDSLDYFQDKVTTLEEYLAAHSTEENKRVVDSYLKLQKTFWSYGVHDAVYKFQPNYGVDMEGRVVCIDIGEFVFTKQEALASIAKKNWLSRPSYAKWPEGELKRYYTQRMEEEMTEAILLNFWK